MQMANHHPKGDSELGLPQEEVTPRLGLSAAKPAGSSATAMPNMDDEQFTQWTELLETRTGMRLPDNRRSFLVTNLGMRMRKLGFVNYQDYYEHIQSGLNGNVEWDQLVHHLTVHETRFLRHQSTLDLIRDHCLPQQASDNQRKPYTLNVWSVGCSTGEEPYSIAMTIDDHMNRLGYECYLGIIASDISRSALAVGREGIYAQRKINKIQPEWLERYFVSINNDKSNSGHYYQVKSELRQRVCFHQVNILDMGQTPIGNMDVIVCQNVLIYYDRKRRIEIADNLVKYLAPGGLIIFATGEMINWPNQEMERFPYPNTLAYRRKQ